MASRRVSTQGGLSRKKDSNWDEVEFVKKTAQWAVFRNSPEGFSLRGSGSRERGRSPTAPTKEERGFQAVSILWRLRVGRDSNWMRWNSVKKLPSGQFSGIRPKASA